MLLEKLSLFNRTKFKIANIVTPLKSANLNSFDQIDFELPQPKLNAILNFKIPDPYISSDYALSNNDKDFFQADLLYESKINKSNFDNLLELSSDIYAVSGYNELFNLDVIINKIDFKFIQPSIRGKNYIRKKEEIQQNLFTEPEESNVQSNKIKKPKIERQYKEENKFDEFDVFDLIFPALQPPLGNNFSNPVSFPSELYPFQVEGIKFLYNSTSALLGDEMGLGKSIQTIVALRVLFRQGKISTVCIICPKAILSDWGKKLWDWAPELKVIKIEGGKPIREQLWNAQSHIYICTYETLRGDFEITSNIKGLIINERGHSIKCPNKECKKQVLSPYSLHYKSGDCPYCKKPFTYPDNGDIAKTNFDLIVFDEIQKTKNPTAGMTKAARTIFAKYKWALTGTPLENKIEDIISVFTTIKPNIFDNSSIDIIKIKETIKPYFKRRRKEDVLKDLPPKITKEVWLDLLPTQREKYDLAESRGLIDLEGHGEKLTITHILALITKLKQICNYDPKTKESAKLDYLKEELEELTEQGDKALVFSQYPNETLKRIQPHLLEFNPQIYDGTLSDLKRTKLIDDFQQNDNSKLMLLSLRAGNAGITLTRANYIYHFDLWWNPAISAQAAGRAHRIGQTKTVFERLLLAEDTIERKIYNILQEKKLLFSQVVDELSDTDILRQSLTEDEIFGLFGLKKQKPQLNDSNTAKSYLNKDFNKLDPFEFEHFIGDLFNKMGYHSKVTKKSNDGGIDIFAKLQTPTGIDEIIIQCKHKENPNTTVGVDKVRELFGVLSANRKLTKGFIITNGRFTSGALEFADGKHIELIDGVKLLGYVDLHHRK